jgi:DNA-binding transcriptional LysR family regulator
MAEPVTDPHAAPANMAEADLGLLFALETLLQENNVTRAAARLGLSQPALSARLNRLRHLFNDPLFVPASNGRGVVPTPHALDLRDNLSDALGILRVMLRNSASFDPASSRRTFVIAMQEQPSAALAPGLTAAVFAKAPAVRLAFIYPSPNISERLEDGTVDLLVAPSEQGNSALIGRALFENDFLTAQRKGHPRGTEPLGLAEFCALDHLVVSTDGAGFLGLVDRALAGLGRSRRVALSIQSYGLAPLIVARTDCITTLPSRLLRRYADDLDLFEPPVPLPRSQLVALWHARNQEEQGHIWLRECLYQIASATA